MIIVCIDNKGMENQLTLNKQYTTINDRDHYIHYYMTNDNDVISGFGRNRFITLEEHRKNIIDSIINSIIE